MIEKKSPNVPVPDRILAKADERVFKVGQVNYGHPYLNFTTVGKMWEAILQAQGHADVKIDAHTVSIMMGAFKIARQVYGYHEDSAVDQAGFAQTTQMIEQYKQALPNLGSRD